MDALQQRCRPKHQVLVLKCYPRTTKGAVDVSPNSSELSYLLFYALSRRTKIEKIGLYLERKTARDVWLKRIGNVQVTLQILTALIEKSANDVTLIAPAVLKILDQILHANDITLAESSIPTLEAFCEHHDGSGLFADLEYLRQYETVVRAYATLATGTAAAALAPAAASRPVALRWRSVGLRAIMAVVSSEALGSVAGRQLDAVVPVVLENLWARPGAGAGSEAEMAEKEEDEEEAEIRRIELLLRRIQQEERAQEDKIHQQQLLLLRRRNSVATARTGDEGADPDPNPNPIALSGSAGDVDKLAEEDIGVLALRCLKQIFVVPNRPQIVGAVSAMLRFVADRVVAREAGRGTSRVAHKGKSGGGGGSGNGDGGWAPAVFELVARWAPVQDRYVIVITAMDALSRTPIRDGDETSLAVGLALASVIGSLLRSDINLIGLSVMDVLLGLAAQLRRPVQLIADMAGKQQPDRATEVRSRQLLERIRRCIGDLATHVYYADQIANMVAAMLSKLRPGRSGSTASSTPHPERADGSAGETADGVGVGVGAIDAYFSQSLGRVAALEAVRDILLTANPGRGETRGGGGSSSNNNGNNSNSNNSNNNNISSRNYDGDVNMATTPATALARNPVPISAWEGTHWLLRDPDGAVRKAYAEALVTWLERETSRDDARALTADEMRPRSGREPHPTAAPARRAVSSASARLAPPHPSAAAQGRGVAGNRNGSSPFLALLHLAVYDSALRHVDCESDFVLLHVLLARLVARLGVNAARHGLPMVSRLQEDIQDADAPFHKVRIGSLCHGYFWALTDAFGARSAAVGQAIMDEVSRRRSKGFWVSGVTVPVLASSLAAVGTPGAVAPSGGGPKLPLREIESEALIPFDDRAGLVECIAEGYRDAMAAAAAAAAAAASSSPSPPSSPPASSPGRGGGGAPAWRDPPPTLPGHFRDQMLSDWTREATLTSVLEVNKSESLNGSRAATTGTKNRLGVVSAFTAANGSGALQPSPYGSQPNLGGLLLAPHGGSPAALALAMTRLRGSSVRSSGLSPPPSPSESSRGGGGTVASVEQLKMALSGHSHGAVVVQPAPAPAPLSQSVPPAERDAVGSGGSSGSESLASYDSIRSEMSSVPPPPPLSQPQVMRPEDAAVAATTRPPSSRRSLSLSRDRGASALGPLTSHPAHGDDEADADDDLGMASRKSSMVPPVPPLPPLGKTGVLAATTRSVRSGRAGGLLPKSAAMRREDGGTRPSTSAGVMDLQELLGVIGGRGVEGSIGGVTKPPY